MTPQRCPPSTQNNEASTRTGPLRVAGQDTLGAMLRRHAGAIGITCQHDAMADPTGVHVVGRTVGVSGSP